MLRKALNSDTLKSLLGTCISQGVTVLSFPVISRLYTPADVGKLAIFSSIVAIATVVACCRYELAIVLPRRDRTALNVVALCFLIMGVLGVALSMLAMVFCDSFASLFGDPLSPFLVLMLALCFFSDGVQLVLTYWFSRKKMFGRLASIRISAALLVALLRIGLGWEFGPEVLFLIVSYLAGSLLSALFLLTTTFRSKEFKLTDLSWRRMSFVFRRYVRFLKFSTITGLLNDASSQLSHLLIGAFFSPTVIGLYALGMKTVQLPLSLVGNAISQTFFPRATDAKREGRLAQLVEDLLVRLLQISYAPLICTAVMAPELFAFIFGNEWLESGNYVRILAPGVAFQFIMRPISTLFNVFEMQKGNMLFGLALLVSRIGSILIGSYFESFALAVGLLSFSGCLVYGLCLVFWV